VTRGIYPVATDRWRPVKVATAAAVLAALIVGIPIALIELAGVPFSHGGVGQMAGRVGASHLSDTPQAAARWIAGIALVLAWSLWAWMALCVVIEIRSWATGRTPVRLPASRAAQSLAAFLVGTTMAVSTVGRAVPAHVGRTAGAAAVSLTPLVPPHPTDDDLVPIAALLTAAPASRNGHAGDAAAPAESSVGTPVAVLAEWPDAPFEDAPFEDVEPSEQVGPMVRDLPLRDEEATSSRTSGPGRELTDTGTPSGPTEPTEPTKPTEPWGRAEPLTPSTPPDPLMVPKTHLVRSRETLWSIAEDELGSALRWHELAQLNYGITQEDGRALDAGHWITAGWRLLLPPSAPPSDPPRPPAPSTPTARAEPVPADADGAPDPILRFGHEGRSEPPHEKVLRPPPEPRSELRSRPGAERSGARHSEDDFTPIADGSVGPRLPRAPVPPVGPVGAGVVGAGVVRLLDRMRRVQQRYRPEGRYIRLPEGDLSGFEQRLRVGDGWVLTYEVEAAIRQVTGPVSVRPDELARVLGVRVHSEVIELVLADTEEPPIVVDRSSLASSPPDTTGQPSREWPLRSRARALAPMLATVGHSRTGLVMVNLESLGSLVVRGNAAAADAVVRALALELSTSFWAGQFSLAVVGFGSELERFPGVRSYPESDELLDTLYRRRLGGTELLEAGGYSSFAHARHVEDSDRWAPLAVICGPTVDDAEVAEILDTASDPARGTAVVAVGERVDAQYSVRLTGDGLATALELLGSVVFPQQVDGDELDKVTTLLDTAASRQSVLSSEEPYVTIPIRLPRTVNGDGWQPPRAGPVAVPVPSPAGSATPPAPTGARGPASPTDQSVAAPVATDSGPKRSTPMVGVGQLAPDADRESEAEADREAEAEADREAEVEVAVLGPIDIRGAARSFSRAWAEELVVYLAMHPNGVSNEAWATALWPDRLMAPSSLHSTASVARRSLGQSADGADYLPRSHGRLALAATVGTDWGRFVALADSDQPHQWRQALTLVRGRPFDGLRASDWPILEGIAPAIEAAVVDLAGRLAGACLQQGDARGAEWAARRGLVVSPYDERLYRMLMRASDLGGNPAGVDALMSELLTLVAEGIEPFDAVHPSTMELYRQLSRRRRFGTPRG
jgi:DNA-binding SARP family transcriptional activator